MMKKKNTEIEVGTGNVFADLDYPYPEEALAKSELAYRLSQIIKKQKLTQAQAASILGIDQPKISKIMKGQLRDFSPERLIRFLIALNQDVEIIIREKPKSRRRAMLKVVPA